MLRNLAFYMAFVGCVPALALGGEPQDVTGTWVAVVSLPNGQKLPFIAHLKQTGTAVTGRLDGINGAPDVPVQNGVAADGKVTFTGVRPVNGQNVPFSYTLTLTASDVLHAQIARQGANGRAVETDMHRLTATP